MSLTVGFTRPRERVAEAERKIRERGWEPVGAPSLDVSHGDARSFAMARSVLESGSAYFTVFGSITAVEECTKEWGDAFRSLLERTTVACTGPSTSEFLRRTVGRGTDVVPETYSGVGVAQAISPEVKDRTVLLLRSDSGDRRIVDMLTAAGAAVLDVAVYKLVPAAVGPEMEALMSSVMEGRLNAMLFTSPLSATSFMDDLRARYGKERADHAMEDVFKVAIGGPTSEGMAKAGLSVDRRADKATFEGMLDAVADRFLRA